jgi:hypothetical protein
MIKSYKYFKGNFVGVSKTKDLVFSEGKYNFYNFKWSYIHINEIKVIPSYTVENEKIGDFYYTKKIKPKSFWRKNAPEFFIPISEEYYFEGELHEVIIKDFKLDNVTNGYIKNDFIELTGTIYFKIEIPTVKTLNKISNPQTNGINKSQKIDNDINSNIYSNSINEIKNKELIFSESNTSNIIQPLTPIAKSSRNWISILFGVLLWVFILGFFWLFLNKYFYIALLGYVGWLVSRFIKIKFIKLLFNIFFTAIFLWVLATMFSDKGTLIDPTVPKKDGTVKISPPKEVKNNTKNDTDYEIAKEINWFDFISNKYGLKYITTVKSFFETQNNHSKADEFYLKNSTNSTNYYHKLYFNLEQYDSKKIDSIVKLLGNKARNKNLNQIQTAEMVITFIQEIPYVLVHQGTCEDLMKTSANNSFIVSYHQDKKPCLADVPGGVQSPYEFLHNLKGDCDTRSLLGYSILKKLNISASVWISEAYGHSILGVGLPVGNGVYKNVNGLNHYAVELTSKGFRLGMISPQQRNMSNWNIALYSNNF